MPPGCDKSKDPLPRLLQAFRTWQQSWLEAALGFLYEQSCQACERERATAASGYVCDKCRKSVRFVQPPFCKRCGAVFEGAITTEFECGNCREMALHFSYARAAVVARDVVMNMIHAYKYNNALWVEPFLTELFTGIAGPALRTGNWDLIVPVPLHPRREAEREFNQAERLGKALSEASGIPLAGRLLARTIDTRTQTRLSQKEREENVRRAFALRGDPGQVKGRRIVLVDDVLTTGATASACARVLRRHGAGEVCAWTLARSLLH